MGSTHTVCKSQATVALSTLRVVAPIQSGDVREVALRGMRHHLA